MPGTAVSIVIPSWNGRRLLEAFLPSVLTEAGGYAEDQKAAVDVLVVDDGSTDGTVEWLGDLAPRINVPLRILRLDRNEGFGAACNAGVEAAAHGLVLLLNNDVWLDRGSLEPLARHFERPGAERLFAVHGQVRDHASGQIVGTGKAGGFARGFLRVHRSFVPREPGAANLPSMFASGGSALFSRRLFLQLGGFDPLFAPFYFEDVELSYRAWKRGLDVAFEPASVVGHQFSSTIAPRAGGQIRRVSHRNRLLMHWIHLHDHRLLSRHVLWVGLLAIAGPLTLQVSQTRGFVDALTRLGAVRTRRQQERQMAARSDREVLEVFWQLAGRKDVQVYDRAEETRADTRSAHTRSA